MNDNLPPIRRVITENDAKGHSRIVEDAPASSIKTVAERPGYRAVNVWRTEEMPAKIAAKDTTREHHGVQDRKSTRLNSSHTVISYAVFCLKKKKTEQWSLY